MNSALNSSHLDLVKCSRLSEEAMKTCINMPIRSSRNKIILTLYLLFAVYLIYVIIFLASMLFRSASDVKTKIRALPKYMSDAEIDKIRVLEVGTLQQQLQQAFGK